MNWASITLISVGFLLVNGYLASLLRTQLKLWEEVTVKVLLAVPVIPVISYFTGINLLGQTATDATSMFLVIFYAFMPLFFFIAFLDWLTQPEAKAAKARG